MRLLTKTTLYFLLAMLSLLAVTGFLLVAQFNRQINQRADQELLYEELQWVNYLQAATLNGTRVLLQTPELLIYPADKSAGDAPRLSTVYGKKMNGDVQIPFRQLNDVVSINGMPYQIVIRKSQEQKQALVTSIISILLIVFVLLLLATLVFNWIISKRLWRPFSNSLQRIRNLGLPQVATVHFEKTDTKEFNELNASLNTMVSRIHQDYVTMKQFTEDAAHEMQTPLAVAQTKLELLLQDVNLSGSQSEAIAQATLALNRLGKLNQSLLLLAKIENQQYEATEEIDLVFVIQKYLRLFDEIIKEKQLIIEQGSLATFPLKIHAFLADSLVSNLVGNAVKYNVSHGRIVISSADGTFCISNTSMQPALDPQTLFKRFSKPGENSGNSNGLGLAIVKRIADTHGISIKYVFANGMHTFCLVK